jgi:hypothetical protein
MKVGASTLHVRAVMPTVSSANWALMIMEAGSEQHAITANNWELDKVAKSTIVLITIDHGGKGKGHGSATMGEIEIAWILVGPGVATGKELTTHVNTYDTAVTVTYVVGRKTPKCWIARPILAVFAIDAARQ